MTIALAGELDMATADELCDLLLEAIGRNDTTEVVVNLDRVTFVDSAAIGAFVAGLRAAQQAGCSLRVAHPHDQVQRVLQSTGMLGVLTEG